MEPSGLSARVRGIDCADENTDRTSMMLAKRGLWIFIVYLLMIFIASENMPVTLFICFPELKLLCFMLFFRKHY
ncbi:hypothetical protein C5E20_08925 [Pectobacterium parmentieri]|nr:hypothetical protein C5E20_08925 [Pectobacterium parmentieri]